MIKIFHLNRILKPVNHLIPSMESIHEGVTDWIVTKTGTLFQEDGSVVAEHIGVPEAAVLLHSGEVIEWSLEQDHKDLLQNGIKEGMKTMTPGIIRRGLGNLKKFIWISVETDEILDEEMNACPVSENMTAQEQEESKKSLFRRAISAITPNKKVFFGFVKVWKKLAIGVVDLIKKAFTRKSSAPVVEKVEYTLANRYIPNTSIPIRGPAPDKILQVRVLYNRI